MLPWFLHVSGSGQWKHIKWIVMSSERMKPIVQKVFSIVVPNLVPTKTAVIEVFHLLITISHQLEKIGFQLFKRLNYYEPQSNNWKICNQIKHNLNASFRINTDYSFAQLNTYFILDFIGWKWCVYSVCCLVYSPLK